MVLQDECARYREAIGAGRQGVGAEHGSPPRDRWAQRGEAHPSCVCLRRDRDKGERIPRSSWTHGPDLCLKGVVHLRVGRSVPQSGVRPIATSGPRRAV